MLVWRLEEDAPQLLALCQQRDIPSGDLINKPVKRQREMAAERLLLCEAFGRPVALSHDQQGAPRVEGEIVNISISHTCELNYFLLRETLIDGNGYISTVNCSQICNQPLI